MRAEYAAALTNFVVVLLIAIWWMLASPLSHDADAVVFGDYTSHVLRAIATAVLYGAPLGIFAFWRTWVHSGRLLSRYTTGFVGVLEAGALGLALTLPFVLPGVVARQFDPGRWGQPQAFMLGLGYAGVYGLIGLAIGLVVGLLLWLSAMAAIHVHRRITS